MVKGKIARRLSPWKEYNWSIVGGVTVIARDMKEAEAEAEHTAFGAWDIAHDNTFELDSFDSFDMAGPEVQFGNWDRLTPQAKKAILALYEKLKAEAEGK